MIGFERLNSHAGEAFGQGQEIHVQAAPSQAELLYKRFKEKKEKLTKNTKRAVLEKYGNAAEAGPLPEGLLMGQTESYVEYDRAGRVVARDGARDGEEQVRGGRVGAEPQGGVGVVLVGGGGGRACAGHQRGAHRSQGNRAARGAAADAGEPQGARAR